MSTVMEATAVIRAKDETGAAFDRIAARMRTIIQLEKTMAAIDRSRAFETKMDSQTAAVDRMMHSMQRIEQIDRAIAQGSGVSRMVEGLDRAASAAKRLDTALSATEARASKLGHVMGNLGIFGGPLLLEGTKKTIESAADLAQIKNRILNVANNPAEVDAADAIAGRASAASPYTTKIRALEDYAEIRSLSVSDNPNEPVDMAKITKGVETMAKMRAALASSGYGMSDEDAKALAQAVEGSGRAKDPKAQEKIADAFVRAKQVFGNALTASMVRDFVANAKASNFSASDSSFYLTTFARLAQGNASRLGNEAAQTLTTLAGGHVTPAGAKWLADLKLINPSQIVKGKGGKFFINGAIKDKDTLDTDQNYWAQTTLLNAIEGHGDLSESKIKKRVDALRNAELRHDPNAKPDEKVLRERAEHGLVADSLQGSGFRSSVIDNLAHAIANMYQTNKDVEQMQKDKGLAAADTLKDNPVAALDELTHSIESFASVLGSPIMKNAANLLDSMAHGISGVTSSMEAWQKQNPELAKWVTGGVLGAAGTAGAVGTYQLLDGMMGGFGLKGSALALDHSALALEAAAGRMGLAGALTPAGRAITAAEEAAGGGILYNLGRGVGAIGRGFMRLAGPIGAAYAAHELLEGFDPKGNLGGLTTPVDSWFKEHLGFDPSHVEIAPALKALSDLGPHRGHHNAPHAPPPPKPDVTPAPGWLDWIEGELTTGRNGQPLRRGYRAGDLLQQDDTSDHGMHNRHNDELVRSISAALKGNAKITVEIVAGPAFGGLVRSIVKSEMAGLNLDGIGSTGHTHPDVKMGPR